MSNSYFIRKDKRFTNFVAIPNSLIQDETITIRSRGILCLMLSYPENWKFYKTHLMKKSGLGRDAFNRSWNELIEKKYIKTFHLRSENGQFSDLHICIFPEPTELSFEEFVSEYATEGQVSQIIDIKEVEPCTGFPSTVTSSTADQHLYNTKGKKTYSKKTNYKKRFENEFEEFWEVYPNKKAKVKAKEAFLKIIKDVPIETLVEAVKQYTAKTDPQFYSHPSTWLNQGRWEDSYEAPKKNEEVKKAVQDDVQKHIELVKDSQEPEIVKKVRLNLLQYHPMAYLKCYVGSYMEQKAEKFVVKVAGDSELFFLQHSSFKESIDTIRHVVGMIVDVKSKSE